MSRRASAVDIKVSNIKKLMRLIKTGKKTVQDAGINRRLDILSRENKRGEMWAADLRREYASLVKEINS